MRLQNQGINKNKQLTGHNLKYILKLMISSYILLVQNDRLLNGDDDLH